ncbi:DNA cytosine methyltransferase [Pseudomonas sp. TWP3-2]|uniref:DNA cytosine methyltransferase n=1 Tax=Pseudomonas sp. TWP3-2 TaxID=2804574 RepID=UPI003CEF8302
MNTVLHLKIGENRAVPRLWMEGVTLARAGLEIGALYALNERSEESKGLELCRVDEAYEGQTFLVSERNRGGKTVPLMEIRSHRLAEAFEGIEKVRVALFEGRIVITANRADENIVQRTRRLLTKARDGVALGVCSLFHGGGVLDKALHHGMQRSGVKSFVQVGVEMDERYLDASRRNSPELWPSESIALLGDIRDVDWRLLPQCDLLAGGVPCTGASLSGRSKNKLKAAEEHKDAGALFFDYLDAVKELNPAVVVLENVPQYRNTASMMVIRSVLSSLGYHVTEAVLNGNDFGTLEARERLIVVGVCRGLGVQFDFEQVRPLREKEATLRSILEPIPLDSKRWRSIKNLKAKAIKDKAAGKGFAPQFLTGDETLCGTIGKGYMKRRGTEPFLLHPDDPDMARLLTKIEHCRVKTIPECVIAGESETVAHEINGQSVCFAKVESVGVGIGQMIQSAVDSFMTVSQRPLPLA